MGKVAIKMEKEIDKFSEKIEGVSGDQIPLWDFPEGSAFAFFDKYDPKPTIAELKAKEEEKPIEKSNTWEKWL